MICPSDPTRDDARSNHYAVRQPERLLTVEDVMRRYRIHDPRSARREMQRAGGRKIGGRWQIRLDVLLAWESNPDPASQLAAGDGQSNHRRDHHQPASSAQRTLPPLAPDWLDDAKREPRR